MASTVSTFLQGPRTMSFEGVHRELGCRCHTLVIFSDSLMLFKPCGTSKTVCFVWCYGGFNWIPNQSRPCQKENCSLSSRGFFWIGKVSSRSMHWLDKQFWGLLRKFTSVKTTEDRFKSASRKWPFSIPGSYLVYLSGECSNMKWVQDLNKAVLRNCEN